MEPVQRNRWIFARSVGAQIEFVPDIDRRDLPLSDRSSVVLCDVRKVKPRVSIQTRSPLSIALNQLAGLKPLARLEVR